MLAPALGESTWLSSCFINYVEKGRQGWFRKFSVQCGGALVQSMSASEGNGGATKIWHMIPGILKEQVLGGRMAVGSDLQEPNGPDLLRLGSPQCPVVWKALSPSCPRASTSSLAPRAPHCAGRWHLARVFPEAPVEHAPRAEAFRILPRSLWLTLSSRLRLQDPRARSRGSKQWARRRRPAAMVAAGAGGTARWELAGGGRLNVAGAARAFSVSLGR